MQTLSLVTTPAVVKTANSYASQVNSRYSKKDSIFVDIKDRFNQALAGLPPMKQAGMQSQIIKACNEFKARYPNVNKFSDLDIVESVHMPLSDILIDTTIQRLLILPWVMHIVSNFRDVQAMPIQVYRVVGTSPDFKYYPTGQRGLYASWDGQNTAAAFFLISCVILGEDPKDVMVPVNIYKVSKKSEIRENFVNGNSDVGKKLLDSIDLWMQMIYGVRIDGNLNPDWVEAEKKQQYLEQADLFVTADKFGDTHMPGAISRMQELNHYSSDIIRKFAMYTTTFPVARPIASQEIEIMCAWFDMAKKDGIDYSDSEVIDLGNHLHLLFGADFHESSQFWEQVRRAYANWHSRYWAGAAQAPSRISFNKNWRNGGTFLWHQLNKTWNGRIPSLRIDIAFHPSARDLY